MSSQVDHDLLADYVGGALDGTPEAQEVAHLIATSPQWRRAADELSAALTAVERDLSILREQTVVMPAEVAARFDELFASPAMAGTTAAARDPLASRKVTRTGERKRRLRRWVAPVAIAAGAVAFFALGGLPNLPTSPQHGAGDTQAKLEQAEAPMAAAKAVPTTASGRHYDRNSLHLAFRASAGSLGTESKRGPTAGVPDMRGNATGEIVRLFDATALQGCLKAVAAALPGTATHVEYAYFESRPALVISITSVTQQWLFVAGTNCGLPGPDELYRTPR